MPIIEVENISKKYLITHNNQTKNKYNSLGETITTNLKHSLSFIKNQSTNKTNRTKEEFWALKNISFNITQGEKIGIIGRNGAGKSTLLKILSRITEPTEGKIRIRGRIASLLEVGTGFHPELTGRENIYLNGAILGMKKQEINGKFDEIVAFSEIEKFIDTPVKRYSSGMYVRLAFSIAAHLEPEILLVDEVLAVGDYQFQQKCIGKMQNVSKEGRTIVFVSHDMNAINNLCQYVFLLNNGMIDYQGESTNVIKRYFENTAINVQNTHNNPSLSNNEIVFKGLYISQNGTNLNIIDCRIPFTIEIHYKILQRINNFRVNILVNNEHSEYIFGTSDQDFEESQTKTDTGIYISKVEIPGGILKIGEIRISIYFDIPKTRCLLVLENASIIRILDGKDTSFSERHKRKGLLAPLLKWEKIKIGNV